MVNAMVPVDEVDLSKERLVMLKDVDQMKIFAKRVSYRTVYNYAMRGVLNLSGIRVYLGFVKTPSGAATSREAVIRFIQELSE